jgi:hypothetical protein
VGDNFSVERWLDAAKKGHTFFTTGPLLDLKINGKRPGESLKMPASGETVVVEGSVESIAPLTKAVLYRNGQVFKEFPTSGRFREQVSVTESSWFSLYAEGSFSPLFDGEYPQAATNAIRVYVGDQKIRNRASAQYFVRWIDKLRRMAEAWPWWRSDAERTHVFAQFAEAKRIFERRASDARH